METNLELDQHFMIDSALIRRIVKYAELEKSDIVLEIGSGNGSLTEKLVNKCNLICVEIDKKLFKNLEGKYKDLNNIKLFNANILDNIQNLKFDKIVANIPYNISEPLMKKILILQPELVVLTTGINFTRYYLKEKRLVDLIYSIEIKEEVSKFAFKPKPKTKSAIVKLTLKQDKTSLFFQNLCKQHDKKIKNALINSLQNKLTKNQVRNKIKYLDSKEKSVLNCSNEEIEKIKILFENLK